MAVSITKIRGFIAGVVALVAVILLFSIGLTAAGVDLPIARDIAGIFGVSADAM